MGKNHCISGVNWASLKKFAKFLFGDKSVVSTRIVEGGRHDTYVIYIEKEKYEKNKELAEKFESNFHVVLKPQE